MKIKTYKVIPVITKMYCDCGAKMVEDTDISKLFTTMLNKEEPTYKYKCSKCGKEFTSNTDYKINEVKHCYSEVIEEKEVDKQC